MTISWVLDLTYIVDKQFLKTIKLKNYSDRGSSVIFLLHVEQEKFCDFKHFHDETSDLLIRYADYFFKGFFIVSIKQVSPQQIDIS